MSDTQSSNPILANVIRGGKVESVHRGSAVVVDGKGNIVFAQGDPGRLIYPRSSYKFIQAVPLVESGAADHFALTEREIALACASHHAESFHVEAVTQWLGKLGLGAEDLENGATWPLNETATHEMVRRGEKPTRIHQNCSGKHTGMLTVARFLEADTHGYSEHSHPSQRRWMQVMADLTGLDTESLHWERDGCGLPALRMPMDKLALAFAQFANLEGPNPAEITPDRCKAMQRILAAVARHPEMIAGTGRCCTAVIEKTAGRILVKTGAEGVFAGVIPERGLGFVLKIDDGASRGSEVALGGLLGQLGLLDSEEQKALQPWFRPEIINSQGNVTGRMEAA